jgi:hypothetical protein
MAWELLVLRQRRRIMPTPAGPGTNQFRCESCGRFFNEEEEFEGHRTECAARQSRPSGKAPGYEQDREWTSTP